MSNFLELIFERLQASPERIVLREVRGTEFVSITGRQLLAIVEQARQWLRSAGLQPGERCGLVAANSIHWIAADLALMAEGMVVVPLYHRQTPSELVAMLKDCQPRLVLSGDSEMDSTLAAVWPEIPRHLLLEPIFS